jgi:hypothetical protein
MEVLGHDHISDDYEFVLTPRFFEDCQETVASFWRAEERFAMEAAAGYKVKVISAIVPV